MKYRFYITNLHEGNIQGTDDETVAKDLSNCDEFFVVDTETGEHLAGAARRVDIGPFITG